MKIKTLLKLIFIIVFLAAILAFEYYFLVFPQYNKNEPVDKPVVVSPDKLFGWKFPEVKIPLPNGSTRNLFDFEIVAYSSIRDPGGIVKGLPVRLKIPIIGVDSTIEDALITPDGRMDVPAGSKNVAWFSLGPQPGQVGSAVIGGHFGISNGTKFVFYDLDKLVVGDKVYIEDDKSNTLAFIVRSIKLFDRTADATTVFTSNDGLAHLNVITCEGIWNQVDGTYDKRRVVFTDQIPLEDIIPTIITPTQTTTTPTIITFSRTLGIGSQGEDVIALQNALQQKGFLVMPAGTAKGFFGALTRAAVIKYQVSVGLPSVGAFGPQTRAKLVFELNNNLVLPNTGETLIPPSQVVTENTATPSNAQTSPSFSQTIIQLIKSLYETPLDILITSLILIAIIFMVFKITQKPRRF